MNPCACGCGQLVEKRWKRGHNKRELHAENYFWDRVDRRLFGCWEWLGSIEGKGYGRLRLDYGSIKAHRYAYELMIGPIPAGLMIDHLCRNKSCVNPAHLEVVTNRENVLRGVRSRALSPVIGTELCV